MQNLILTVLNNYLLAKKTPLKNHALANNLRHQPISLLSDQMNVSTDSYIVKGSVGQGNWADIPWIAIFDSSITKSATKGYYIVYLFRSDMSGVYLSLNQGWTYFEKKYGVKTGQEKISQVSSGWRKKLSSSSLSEFTTHYIDLKSNNNYLAQGYEKGHICGKFYDKENIPNNLELARDLTKLMGIYNELSGHIQKSSIEQTNDKLIVDLDLGLIDDDTNDNPIDGVDTVIENFAKSHLTINDIPENFTAKESKLRNFKTYKNDLEHKSRVQKKLGYAGELMVLNYEKGFLISENRHDLAEKVKHVSLIDGDGAGYDILSFDLSGNEKKIEVKTTTLDCNRPFYITDNELEFSRMNKSEYYLYRVYEFDSKNNCGKFYCIEGDLSDKLSISPNTYVVKGIL